MARENITHIEWLRKKLKESKDDHLRTVLGEAIQMLMSAESLKSMDDQGEETEEPSVIEPGCVAVETPH